MSSSNIRPKWWQLYLILPLLVALFMLDFRLKLSIRGHQAVQIGILLLVYGLVHLWLKANLVALSKMDHRHYHRRITVIRIHPSELPNTDKAMLQIPDSEIKGVLGDTFDMDYIDAEFVQQEESDGRAMS
jgi:hypothetical protein